MLSFSKCLFTLFFVTFLFPGSLFSFADQEALVSKRTSENFIINPNNIYLIEKAWSVNTSGGRVKNYYAITINGKFYNGCRLWDNRWNVIKDATDYAGKNILELGCNMALVSTFLKKYRDANIAVGVEGPNAFLVSQGSPHRVKAAKWFAQAFEADVGFIQVNLNGEPNYEGKIGYDYDVVFCFSLMHWIKDKKRLLRYLAQFNEVIYEGHDSLEVELKRFKDCGFSSYRVLGKAERGQIIHFVK